MNEDGSVLGIVTEENEGYGEAVAWDDVARILEQASVPMNLPQLEANYARELLVRLTFQLSPSPGEGSEGESLAQGFRFEYGVKLAYSHALFIGLTRLAFTDNPYRSGTRYAEQPDSYTMTYFSAGYRWEPAIRLLRRGPPQSLTIGGDILAPVDGTAPVVTWVTSDSVDYRTGEFVYVRGRRDADAGISFAAHVGLRIPVSGAIALMINRSWYQANISYLDEDRRDLVSISVGAEYRHPM